MDWTIIDSKHNPYTKSKIMKNPSAVYKCLHGEWVGLKMPLSSLSADCVNRPFVANMPTNNNVTKCMTVCQMLFYLTLFKLRPKNNKTKNTIKGTERT